MVEELKGIKNESTGSVIKKYVSSLTVLLPFPFFCSNELQLCVEAREMDDFIRSFPLPSSIRAAYFCSSLSLEYCQIKQETR